MPGHVRRLVHVLTSAALLSLALVGVEATVANAQVPLPAVTSISPSSGPTTGGTTVTITGTGFTGATKVVFGTVAAASFTAVSSTEVTAVSPAQAAAWHNIYMTTPNGTSAAVTADEFTYEVLPPSISGISPTSGPTTGGTTVTITGTGFTGATKVVFGTVAATSFTVMSSTEITAVSPAQAAAWHNIYVTTQSGTSAPVSLDEFTYVNSPPSISGISPTSGPTTGGTTVTITGTGFTGATKVVFGTVAAASFAVMSSTEITAVSPVQAAGFHNIYVTTPAGTSATVTADQFTYVTTSSAPFGTALSSNRRYIVDQSGNPWLMVGDSVWSLMSQLSVAQMQTYFSTRQSQGFNAALVSVLSTPYSGMNTNANADNFATYDGVTPFTVSVGSTNWLASPNPTYFNRVLAMVELAATYGFTILLDPYETGWNVGEEPGNTTANTTAVCRAYGQYLGNLFKSQPNVIWSGGDDYSDYSGYDAYVLGIQEGIASVAPNQLQTVELYAPTSGQTNIPNLTTDDSAWPTEFPNTLINGSYTYWSQYWNNLRGYNYSPVFPVFGAEYQYEGSNNGSFNPAPNAMSLRAGEWWTMTSGGAGQLYGNGLGWNFGAGYSLTTPGAIQFGYQGTVLKGLAWWKLVPDQGNTFLTAGQGTAQGEFGNPSSDPYATAAVASDGTVGMVYAPQATTLTINMAKMIGTVTARWCDPTTGAFTAIGTYANTGTHQFASPAAHSDGSRDWVLVLTASPTSAPTVTGLSVNTGPAPGGTAITIAGTTSPERAADFGSIW